MLQIGKVLIGLSIATAVAFANPTSELGAHSLSKTDREFLFNNNSANAVALGGDEMKATEGKWWNWGLGGLAGGGLYVNGWYRGNYAWNTNRFIGNTVTGAVIGGTFGRAGALAGGGRTFGNMVWKANSFGMNYGVNLGWRR